MANKVSLKTETSGITGLGSNGYQLVNGNNNRNLKYISGDTGSGNDIGISGYNGAGDWRFQLYGTGGSYGFLDANWAAWDLKKNVNGQFQVDEGSGLQRVWNAGNDGSGSGLDADTVDGLQASQFLRTDADSTIQAVLTTRRIQVQANHDIRFTSGNWTGNTAGKIQHHSNWLYLSTGSNGIVIRGNSGATDRWYFRSNGHLEPSADSAYDIGANATRVRNGYFDTLYGDGSNLTGISAGATGGGSDEVFYENGQTVTTSYTITNGKNAMAAGPITIQSGAVLTVGSGENLTIV